VVDVNASYDPTPPGEPRH